jgi:amidase
VRGDLAVIGPMARSAADLALELSVAAGPDELTEALSRRLRGLPQPAFQCPAACREQVLDHRRNSSRD